jgi:hypothetical protein
MAEYVELYVDQGSDFTASIVLQDDITDLYQNVDGYVITSSLRRSLLSQNVSGEFQCSITDAANGEMTIYMTAANTANLHIGTHIFDVKMNVDGSISRLLEGLIIVTPSITR